MSDDDKQTSGDAEDSSYGGYIAAGVAGGLVLYLLLFIYLRGKFRIFGQVQCEKCGRRIRKEDSTEPAKSGKEGKVRHDRGSNDCWDAIWWEKPFFLPRHQRPLGILFACFEGQGGKGGGGGRSAA